MLFVCYPKCTTCQKAKAWLEARGLPAEVRDIKTQNPSCAAGTPSAACPSSVFSTPAACSTRPWP